MRSRESQRREGKKEEGTEKWGWGEREREGKRQRERDRDRNNGNSSYYVLNIYHVPDTVLLPCGLILTPQ